jgi:simple sugar transport system permease protein
MIAGAIAAAIVGAQVALPGGVHPVAALAAAACAGGLYGLAPALLKIERGVHEVISTIMLNWIAVSLVENWLVVGPLRARSEAGASISGTDQILPTAELPRLLGEASRLHAGLPLALALAIGTWVWLGRTRLGFEVRAVGLAQEAARTAGIPVGRRICEAMCCAGALAGLAGGVLVLGTEYQFPATLGAPYGFDGIAIALIGQNHPLGVAASAIFFGVLRAGGTRMQLLGVHKSFPELIQGLALLLVAGRLGWEVVLRWRARPALNRHAEVRDA